MCPNPNFLPPTAAPAATGTGTGATATGVAATGAANTGVESVATKNARKKSCRKFAKTVLEDNNANYATITKLITFLLGFYVSNIINRWWNKVRSVPKVKNPSMVLSALTWEDAKVKEEDLTSPAAVAEAKKMVARYCLLSWTMCFNTFSQPLAETCGTAKDLERP